MTPEQALHTLESDLALAAGELQRIAAAVAAVRRDLLQRQATPAASAAVSPPSADIRQTPVPVPPSGPQAQPAAAPAAGYGLPPQSLRPRTAILAPGLPHPPAYGPPPTPAASPPLPTPAPSTAFTPAEPWWRRSGVVATLLGGAGALVMLLGVVMLLAIAIAHGVFGPVARVTSGALLAVALVAGAIALRRRDRGNAGAVAMAGTGYAAAYLDVVAVTSIYHWVPAAAGLTLAFLIAASGLWLARKWESQFMAILTVLGAALLIPVVGGLHTWLTPAFCVALAAATLPVHLGRQWPAVHPARIVPAALVLILAQGPVQSTDESTLPLYLTAALLFAVAVAGARLPRLTRREQGVAALTLVAGAAPALTVSFLPSDTRGALWALAMGGCALVALVAFPHTGRQLHPAQLSLAGVATLALLIAVERAVPNAWTPACLAAITAAYLVLAGLTRSRLLGALAVSIGVLAALSCLPTAIAAALQFEAVSQFRFPQIATGVAMAAAAGTLWWLAARPGLRADVVRLGLAVGWAGTLVGVTIAAVAVGVSLGRASGDAVTGFRTGHAVGTVLWSAAAAYLLMIGLRGARDRSLSIRAGVILVALAVGKLLLFDLRTLSGMPRVLAFIVVGGVLLGMGAGYTRALDRAGERIADPGPATPQRPTPVA